MLSDFSIYLFSFNIVIANAQSCEQLNTHEFSEKLSWGEEDLTTGMSYKCLKEDNGRYIWLRDGSGSIPLLRLLNLKSTHY